MKKCLTHHLASLALTVGLGLIPVPSWAQAFTTLHAFAPVVNGTNSDGTMPYGAPVVSGGVLYGTTFNAGANSNGTVFAVNADGTGFTNLYTFTAKSGLFRTNLDGGQPIGGLVLLGNTLYGTSGIGGTAGRGTIFAINTDGSGFTNLHNFNGNTDGVATAAGLVWSGGRLYGASQSGGSNGSGMLFGMNLDGSSYTVLHSFAGVSGSVNSEGAQPLATMTASGTNLFGTCVSGGTGGKGTVFRINTDGSGFTNLHNFTALNNRINSDGANPYGNLFASGSTLYGTASVGGSFSNGTVFVMNTDGTGFEVLYNFSGLANATNNDGALPVSGVLSSNTLYGVAHTGGSGGSGTVFSLFVPPPLSIGFAGTNVMLIWPTNADGFTLQSATNLTPMVVWSAVSPASVVINGQNVVSNSITGEQVFYRLVR